MWQARLSSAQQNVDKSDNLCPGVNQRVTKQTDLVTRSSQWNKEHLLRFPDVHIGLDKWMDSHQNQLDIYLF